ncbi:hypothetical protein HHK36_015053 [Tetracentron sinense]|uniref:CCHC-type domain-containing protein n=1 Tax=Tetracentron sinense TaxID=13715 RepID=A0A834Z6H2_TETSI|nr:hypothetical protein HHK36_015053 [Tetracentron sinense]
MDTEDVIDLHASSVSGSGSEDNELHNSKSVPSEVDSQFNNCEIKEDILNGENLVQCEGDCGDEDGKLTQGADLDKDLDHLVDEPPILRESADMAEIVTMAENMNSFNSGVPAENDCPTFHKESSIRNHNIDGSRLTSILPLSQDSNEVLESGEETYFPALHVGVGKSSTVSFWMENQARKQQSKEFIPLDGDSVPLYDREYALGLTSMDGLTNLERGLETIETSRCFNCGSYNHSMKECPKPRDNVAVNNARKQHMSKRNQTAGSRNSTRYYQSSPGGKYDGLRPGALCAETRQLLGLGELDPPPWLNRMREIGYPPGYLVPNDDDQPSGIIIYADEEIKEEQEDGEIFETGNPDQQKKMCVEFPGVNAPIPENADQRRWAASQGGSGFDPSRNRLHHRSNRSSEGIGKGNYRDQRWSRDYRDDGPPGCDPGASPSMSGFTQRTIMAKTPHDSSFSFSRRHFHWRRKVEEDGDGEEEVLTPNSSSHFCGVEKGADSIKGSMPAPVVSVVPVPKKKLRVVAVSKLRSVLTVFSKNRLNLSSGLGSRVVGTLFGYRRGHVHFAFQEDPKSDPAFLIELATPTSGLVREMASGLVRIALECDKKVEKKGVKLLEESLWRTYCNGKKCGFAMRRECGPEELKVLKSVEPISMGAGVLPGNGVGSEGELMYMRAKFERVVGSRDSEAFYMMNPDGNGGPELSIYLLRV